MRCINFDEHFADFVSDWATQHGGEYRNFDAMEADMPRIYTTFLNTPAVWLEGVTPGAFFTQFEDPKDLTDWLLDYCRREIPVPDLLLEQIMTVGRPCEKRLLTLLKDEEAPEEARMTAITLLRDMESDLPKMTYIEWQLNRQPNDDLAEHALESLVAMGRGAVPQILQNLNRANTAGQEAFMEVLVQEKGNRKVVDLALKLFRQNPARRGLFAGYLAKLEDEAALPALREAALDPRTDYPDYIEIVSAIEALGGEKPERDFSGDPSFDALSGMTE